ncbi:hypothetical protein R1sor_027177 [Riccia sorocarpa]|uniref:Endonuclease/exonuclease/phosphatase domain-containing protein n=1 Tax=Riccia sorocarpa TaxID=122646 RepID=A0ABD3GHP4_9MARC
MFTEVSEEKKDEQNQFIILRLKGRTGQAFLFITYFAPAGAPVYVGTDAEDPFGVLTREVTRYKEVGPVFLVGDFNSRISAAQGEVLQDNGAGWSDDTVPAQWTRTSEDVETNRFADAFLRFVSVAGLTILNDGTCIINCQDVTRKL